jgi:hypothetical protein
MSVQTKAIKAVKAVKKTITKKTTEKYPETERLAKRWRRGTYGSDRTKYGDGAFAQSTKWVDEQLKMGRTVAQIEGQIEAIKQARRSAANPSGTAEVKPETKKSSKPAKAILKKQASNAATKK